jgi:hypothetical protein
MARVADGISPEEAVAKQLVWSFHPWRFLPPLLVLLTVAAIWATRYEQLIVNDWAYPLTLVVVGLGALLLLIRARPRRVHRPLPYPD